MLGFLRSKRFWKRAAISFALLIAVLFIVNGVMAWRAESRLHAKIEALRAAGEPASISDLQPKPIPDDQNAAAILEKVLPNIEAFEKEYRAFFTSPDGEAYEQRKEEGKPPTDAEFAAMREIVNGFPTILAAIAEASAANGYASRFDFNLPASQFMQNQLDGSQRMRTITRYADWKMAILVAEGNQDDAVQLGIQTLRLARLYDEEPLLIHYLVSIAVRGVIVDSINSALRSGPIDPQVRNELDEELALQDNRQPLQRALRYERAFAIDYTRESSDPMTAALRWPMSNWYWRELEMLDRAVQDADKPWHEIRPEWDRAYAEERGTMQLAGLDESSLIGESLRAVFWADAGGLTLTRSLRILNAMGRYRERTGDEAQDVTKLGLPPEAVIDPWSGEPLRIKATDDGPIVYSVWRNGVDDGGQMDYGELDWGVVPRRAYRASGN